MNILICEPEPAGHHLRYVAPVARQALNRGHSVTLATTNSALAHPAWQELRAAVTEAEMPVVEMRDPLVRFLPRFSRWQQIPRAWLSWLAFRRCYQRVRPDLVLMPYFDDLEPAFALIGSPFGRTPWAGIVMKTRFHQAVVNPFTPPARLGALRKFLFERNLFEHNLRDPRGLLITIDETLTEFYRALPEPPRSLHFVGEPADLSFTLPKAEARRRLSIPADGCYVLFYGNVHMRKGVAEILAAVSALPPETGVKILMVGPQDAAEREYINTHGAALRAGGRLFEIDRFASEEDESVAFSAADIVWVGYSRHYSPSSVLGKACRAGCALIGCREGNIGWTISRYGLGIAVNIADPAAVIQAIGDLARGNAVDHDTRRANQAGYAAGNSSADFGNAIVDLFQVAIAAGTK